MKVRPQNPPASCTEVYATLDIPVDPGDVEPIGEEAADTATSSETAVAARAALARECDRQRKHRRFWLSLGDAGSVLMLCVSAFYLLPLAHTQGPHSLSAKLFAAGF